METNCQLHRNAGVGAIVRDQKWASRSRVGGPRRPGLRGNFGRVGLSTGPPRGQNKDLGLAQTSYARTAQYLRLGWAGATEESDWTRSAAHRRYISFGRVKLGQRTSWREQDRLREDSAASSDRLAGAAEERRGVPATARTGWGGLSGARTTQRLRKGWDGDTEEPDRIGWCALG